MHLWPVASPQRLKHSPLRRRSDVVQLCVLMLLSLIFAVAASVGGLITAYSLQESAARKRAASYRVTAVLQSVVPEQDTALGRVSVRWKAEDGSLHTGTARFDWKPKGSGTIRVWVTDHATRLVSRPPSPTQGMVTAVEGGIVAALGVGLLFLLVRFTIQRAFCRFHMREWEREWTEKGPGWSGRSR